MNRRPNIDNMGNILIDRETVRLDVHGFQQLGFNVPVMVAAMDTNIEIDNTVFGDVVEIDRVQFHFVRDERVKHHQYWIISEQDWQQMRNAASREHLRRTKKHWSVAEGYKGKSNPDANCADLVGGCNEVEGRRGRCLRFC